MDNRKIESKEENEDDDKSVDKNLDLKEFDAVKQMKIDSFIIVNAQRRYGKTIWYKILNSLFII